MKRLISVLLVLSLMACVTACGGKDPSAASKSTAPGQSQTPTVPAPQPEADCAVTPIHLMKGEGACGEWGENYEPLCYASWEELTVGEAYPELEAALENLNSKRAAGAGSFLQEWLSLAREAQANNPEYFGGFTNSSRHTVQRADSLVLSVREDCGSYTGGVHPNYGVAGWNFHTATGEQLALEDVLTYTDGLDGILAEKLLEKYAAVPFSGLEETLKGYVPENYVWTLGYQGITFYFSPYEIAPYAAGLLTVTLWFDEMPELFREEYTVAPQGGYAMAMPRFSEVEWDITDADGRDTLSYMTVEGENGEKYLTVNFNGRNYTEESWWAYSVTPYLVCVGESGSEKYYLYVEGSGENDDRTLHVYDLNAGEPELIADHSNLGFYGYWENEKDMYYCAQFTDPTRFTLSRRSNLLGTKSAWRDYEVAANGMPTPLSEFYELDRQHPPITTIIPLELTMLPQNRVETLPAGTDLFFLRTDNETYVDMMTADGQECRVEVEEIDRTPTVNGVPEWDCFENLLYAG